MSHASLLVIVGHAGTVKDVKDLVAEQMDPFDENGECLRGGSRWDYWVIGGRWSGKLHGGNMLSRKEVTYTADTFPPFFAVLQNKRWNESRRLGKSGSGIVSWNDDPAWEAKFFNRFVRDVDPDQILVVVDYHV